MRAPYYPSSSTASVFRRLPVRVARRRTQVQTDDRNRLEEKLADNDDDDDEEDDDDDDMEQKQRGEDREEEEEDLEAVLEAASAFLDQSMSSLSSKDPGQFKTKRERKSKEQKPIMSMKNAKKEKKSRGGGTRVASKETLHSLEQEVSFFRYRLGIEDCIWFCRMYPFI